MVEISVQWALLSVGGCGCSLVLKMRSLMRKYPTTQKNSWREHETVGVNQQRQMNITIQ